MNQSIIAKTDFFIYCPAKTGSSSLIHLLNRHPEINSIVGIKEPQFFRDTNITETKLMDYNTKFPLTNKLTCEKSTGYFPSPIAIQNIKQYCKPNVKFITILRNPIDRLISCYLNFKAMGLIIADNRAKNTMRRIAKHEGWLHEWLGTEQDDGSSKIFSLMPNLIDIVDNKYKNYYWMIDHGFYNKHLERFYKYYDKSSIRIYLYDDWKQDNKKILVDICNFLEIDPTFFITDTKTLFINSSNAWITRLNQCGVNYNISNDISQDILLKIKDIYSDSLSLLKHKLDIQHNW